MKASQRLGRLGLVLLLGGTVGGVGFVSPAHADDPETVSIDSGSGSTGADNCVNSFVSRGRAVVAGPIYEIPYRSVGGGPYVENEVNSRPSTFSFASDAYEGWIGDIVLGTSGVYPRNITSAVAHWPPVPDAKNGGATGQKTDIQFGPFAHTHAEAGPRDATSKAQAFGDDKASQGVIGPSTALSNTLFDGKVLKGVDEVVGYDLHIGPVLVKQMHSIMNYETDGTQDGTKATWKLEFSGVGGDKDRVYTITPDGFAPQGQSPQPGAAGVKQFNDGAAAFADALESAGVTRGEAKIAPGKVEVRAPGELYVSVAAIELRNALVPAHQTTGHAQGWTFGYNERYLKLELGTCDADVNKEVLDKYDDPPTNQREIGPVHFPDPTPGGYGGPKSTTPVPGPAAAVTATVSKLAQVATRPAPTPVATASPRVGARPFSVPWASGVS
jgi:hypothetical protein